MNNPMQENDENIALIWFDPVTNSPDNLEEIKKRLQAMNNLIRFPTNIDECINSVGSFNKEKIFLILSNDNAFKLLPKISNPSKLKLYSVFIFPTNRDKCKRLRCDYPMIVDIFDNHNDLIKSIAQHIKGVNRQMETIAFYDQYQRGSRALFERSAGFLWFQLFKYVIQQLPHDAKAKEDMLKVCREYYHNNSRILRDIDNFNTNYHEDDCIRWYTKEGFIYKIINKALRREDIDQLYLFRYYISDLSKQLAKEYEKIKTGKDEKLHLYRGTAMHMDEIQDIRANCGKLIANNGYLSSSRNRHTALTFARAPPGLSNMFAVLFHIECDLKSHNDSVIVADVSQLSEFPTEDEYVFDADSIFCVENVSEIKEGVEDLIVVQMRTTKEGREKAKAYIEDCRKEMQYESPTIMVGVLLKRLGQADKSLRYFERLLKEPGAESISHIYNRMGVALRDKCEYDRALDYFEKAYTSISEFHPPEKVYTALILHNKGQIYCKKRKNQKAFPFYLEAKKILEEEISVPNRYIAEVCRSIGRYYFYEKEYTLALKYYFEALQVRENCLSPDSVVLAFSYEDIAYIYSYQRLYDDALCYHQKALELRQQFLPPIHRNTAWSLYQIGQMYYNIFKVDEALNHGLLALDMIYKCPAHTDQRRTIDSILQHIELTCKIEPRQAIGNISLMLKTHVNIDPAIYFHMVDILIHISQTYQSMNRFEKADDFYKEALKIQLDKQLIDELYLAREFYCLANRYKAARNIEYALECYKKVMSINDRYYPIHHPLCVQTRRNIHQIERQRLQKLYYNIY
ncbi:unnamed protein product [Adineta ricciae]|uniref:ADP ribosyltransferase domain-containing protein n=1 Tax=Adineta ricciae TaxID=249248 RepID=A0A815SAS8_ADIRI|nr:unnamed protein product [Adineta ricciae]CAF1489502.1 unnamed protein product [Adineta ricciae]